MADVKLRLSIFSFIINLQDFGIPAISNLYEQANQI